MVIGFTDFDFSSTFWVLNVKNVMVFLLETMLKKILSHWLTLIFIFHFRLIVFIVVYLIGGILFLKYYKKEEGSDVIPNREFWSDFPSKVKVSWKGDFRLYCLSIQHKEIDLVFEIFMW